MSVLSPTLFDLQPYTVTKTTNQIDVIFTTRPTDPAAFFAHESELLVGCISTDKRILETIRYEWAFKVEFIDNDYFNYNHAKHLEVVKVVRPKYATVRDMMTEEQCQAETERLRRQGKSITVQYYSFDQIMTWAKALSEYAQNVIVIPKYDCIDQIPKSFVLGYSVPTGYGGTPVPVERFNGRRVHLLGGRFDEQLKKLAELGDSVVSLDNNYIQRIAKFGDYILPDGRRATLQKNGLGYVRKPRLIALALSFEAMMARLKTPL